MALVTVAEAKTFLNIQDVSAAIDTKLTGFIAGITPVVERRVGPVEVRTETSVVRSNGQAVLPFANVISIQSVTIRATGTTVTTTGIVVDGTRIKYASGASLPYGDLTIAYTVGMTVVPSNIKYGALEIISQAWETQRNKEVPAFLIPYRGKAWPMQHDRNDDCA